MTPKTLQQLQYYVGKVCSIVTTSMNRAFDEQISREHFVIRVQTINSDGIWGTHPYTEELVSFFALPHIISIHQEIEIDPNDPKHADMIKDYEEKTGRKLEGDLKGVVSKKPESRPTDDLLPILDESPTSDDSDIGDSTFVDIASLERLAETTKKTFAAYDLLSDKH